MNENGHNPIDQIAAALAMARTWFKPISRSKTVKVTTKSGGSYTFDYAPFEDLIEATQEALTACGLSVIQSVVADSMVSTLIHSSGQSIDSAVPFLIPPGSTNQERGGAIQYARRYGYTCLLCLAADDDDDANAADGNKAEVVRERPNPELVQDSGKRWLSAVVKQLVKDQKWEALGLDEASAKLLVKADAVGDIARTTLMQTHLLRMPSTPPTEEEFKTVATILVERRDGNLQL